MRKKERAQVIDALLNRYFPNPPMPLNHRDPYTLLLAVLLSAQCTDKRVNLSTPTLFSRASTPEEMAALPLEIIEEAIRPCGLASTKSKAMQKLSQILLEKHGGQVPCTFEALESLPGVGHKTASVLMSYAFNRPAFPVDTHIHRCAERWGLSDGKSVVKTEGDLKATFPKKHWKRLHLQIIYYAREYCPARGHAIERCPICKALPPLPR